MRYILIIVLFLAFAYALGLVLVNSSEVAVNLLFTQAPSMNLGLLLILCMVLGVVIGVLLSLLMFKVLQNKWEINRLNKENAKLKDDLKQALIAIDRQANAPAPTYSVYADPTASTTPVTPTVVKQS